MNCHQTSTLQFEGNLYQQVDGVAEGSPLGPLMANTCVYNIEKQLETKNKVSTLMIPLADKD